MAPHRPGLPPRTLEDMTHGDILWELGHSELGHRARFARAAGAPADRMRPENPAAAPSRSLPMRRCGRKKDSLMVESSGCAAFGHPAATQGSLSDYHREEAWAAEASR